MLQNQLRHSAPACPSRATSGPNQNPATHEHREARGASNPTTAVQRHPKDSDCWWPGKKTRDCVEYNSRVAEVVAARTTGNQGSMLVNAGTLQTLPVN